MHDRKLIDCAEAACDALERVRRQGVMATDRAGLLAVETRLRSAIAEAIADRDLWELEIPADWPVVAADPNVDRMIGGEL